MQRSIRFAPLMLIALACAASTGSARAEEGALAVALSTEAAARAAAVSAPEISAPVSVSAFSDQAVTIQADATDPDAGDILTITQTGAPASLTLSHTPSISPAMATLSGTLGSADVGSFMIHWEVSDGIFTASTTTALDVAANQDPTISSPATFATAETLHRGFAVTAGDPDGDVINSLTATGVPTGATFVPNALKTGGLFDWTPALGQAGDYVVTFTVSSGSPARFASTATAIHVGPQDHFPVITSPATVTGVPNIQVTFNVSVADADGDAITELVAEGTQATDLPPGAVFTVNPTNTAGTFTWTPTQAQNVGINIIAVSGALNLRTVKVTRINVLQDRPPVVTAPATVPATEGSSVTINVTASDPDASSPIASLTAAPLPLGATFSAAANKMSGTLNWLPDFNQAGTYNVVFTATNALVGTATTSIVVANQNRAPVADADGPYSGTTGSNVMFNGSGSSDPDGDVLTYAWDFGDGNTGTGVTSSHMYSAGGVYTVGLRVTDTGGLFGDASTTATIQAQVQADIVLENDGSTIDARKTGNRSTKMGLEQQVLPYVDLLPATILIATTFPNSGFVTECPADPRFFVIGDLDADGTPDANIRFTNKCLANLFNNVPDNSVQTVVVTGQFAVGGSTVPLVAQRDLTIRVKHRNTPILAIASPNPFNPETMISYTLMTQSAVTMKIYSVDGRLVRTLKQNEETPSGTHDVTWNGTDDGGRSVSSGIYFVKTSQVAGGSEASFILKVALTK